MILFRTATACALGASLLSLGTPAAAAPAQRVVTVPSFDRLRIDGPYRIELTTGRGASARIVGEREAVDRVDLSVQGQTLVVRVNRTEWKGGWPGATHGGAVTILLATGELHVATITGSGSLKIDRLRGPRVSLSADGSAALAVGDVDVDRIDIGLLGSSAMTIAGRARIAAATIRGSSSLSGDGFTANQLVLNSESAGMVALGARDVAKIKAIGAGDIVIGGKPTCTVDATGAGDVACGR